MPPSKLPVSVLAVLGLATVAACDGGDTDDTATGPCLSPYIDTGDTGEDPEDSGTTGIPALDASAARAQLRAAGITPIPGASPKCSEVP